MCRALLRGGDRSRLDGVGHRGYVGRGRGGGSENSRIGVWGAG